TEHAQAPQVVGILLLGGLCARRSIDVEVERVFERPDERHPEGDENGSDS
ncbi:MAG: hypothetical protein JWN04_482, partial [Myxococcaceae bacterium]|nr:hypothetical protein [Myxococcaceae bacterium]